MVNLICLFPEVEIELKPKFLFTNQTNQTVENLFLIEKFIERAQQKDRGDYG